MRRTNHERTKFIGSVLFLLVFAVGIGYAVLTERLTVDQTINYESMKWDVGFTLAVNGNGTVDSVPTLSQDKRTISVSCNIGMTSESQTCVTRAVIKNGGTFNVELETIPIVTFDNEYVESVTTKWIDNGKSIKAGDVLSSNNEKELEIVVVTKELTKESLSESKISTSVKLTFNWVESDGVVEIVTYDIGQEITIDTEKFNVISDNGDTVTMLAQYVLDTDNRQNSSSMEFFAPFPYVDMRTPGGWGKPLEPLDFDIHVYSTEAALYVDNYVNYLNEYLNSTTITGDLITLKQLKALGCNIDDGYSRDFYNCDESQYIDFIFNAQYWMTRSADIDETNDYFYVDTVRIQSSDLGGGSGGVRPVITISKTDLDNLDSVVDTNIINFYIDGTLYQAEEGMTFIEWAYSSYNTSGDFTRNNASTCTTSDFYSDRGQLFDAMVIHCNTIIVEGFDYGLGPA